MDQCSEVTSTSGIGGVRLIAEKMKVDEMPPEDEHLSTTTTKPRSMPALYELKHKKWSYCEIPSCEVKKVDKLSFASASVLAFYGFKNRLAVVKVCNKCLEKANNFQKKTVDAIRHNETIFKWKNEPQPVVETIDLDDDDEDDDNDGLKSLKSKTSKSMAKPDSSRGDVGVNDEIKVDFERGEVEGLVHQVMKKFNIQTQVEQCKKVVTEEADNLSDEMIQLDKVMESVSDQLHLACERFNHAFVPEAKPVVFQEIEINADGYQRKRNLVDINSKTHVKPAQVTNLKETDPDVQEETLERVNTCAKYDSLNRPDRKPGPASKTSYFDNLEAEAKGKGPFERIVRRPRQLQKKLLPTPSVIPKIVPKDGDIVYAQNGSLLNYWLQGEVLEVIENQDTGKLELVVHYEPTKNSIPTNGREGDGAIRIVRQVLMKEIAYNVPCPFVLPVGIRVIAKYVDELNSDPMIDGYYFAGVVAEQPKIANKFRYLIFFDDGFAQYVYNEDVLLVAHSSSMVWEDVHTDSHDFIKEYITRYPDWPMVRLSPGMAITVEWNGKWWNARVLQTDSSMVKLKFDSDGRVEWIYRGSSRLRPIYKVFEKENNKNLIQQSQKLGIPRHDYDTEQFKARGRPGPVVEYTNDDDKISTDTNAKAVVVQRNAKKSTGGSRPILEGTINTLDIDVGIEFQGAMNKIKIPEDSPKPKQFIVHQCSPDCVIPYEPSSDLKRLSPLALPLYLGWERELAKAARSKSVFYRTPCGLRLKNYTELNNFLEVSNCNFSIDHFCFDEKVDCLNEFVPSRALGCMKDISYGKEKVPVICVNAVDYDTLPYMEYTPLPIPSKDVNLNTEDKGFLVCCDCTDNCQDKTKCACWKLTQEGISFSRFNDPSFPISGYENGRLKDHIVSGIFECNDSCSCKKTCSNRVVQHGVKWPVQIFKTTKKGWGIRALYDMPEGAFICIYSGEVLTDRLANEEGMENGDEYLAELDFIECNEATKADYESDVTDIEEEENGDKEGNTPKRPRLSESDAEAKLNADSSDSEMEVDGHADDTSFVPGEKVDENPKPRGLVKRKTDGRKKRQQLLNVLTDEMVTAKNTSSSNFNLKLKENRKLKPRPSLRDFLPEDQQCFILDAKKFGNLGRYLNHSCHPNVFVQNVFVDTHDLRFPLVAFFTNSFVRAGTELTWDYHYQIGSVPGKTLYCYCMTPFCRGRLL